jgi:hypothetical protein
MTGTNPTPTARRIYVAGDDGVTELSTSLPAG